MTVKELKNFLNEFDDNLEIYIYFDISRTVFISYILNKDRFKVKEYIGYDDNQYISDDYVKGNIEIKKKVLEINLALII